MDIYSAVDALAALAQENRLAAFRLLVRVGDKGLPAGAIAESLAIPHNTLSTHLGILARAGLVSSRRQGRSIIYRIDFGGTRSLLGYLLEDCCRADSESCQPVLDAILPGCCNARQC